MAVFKILKDAYTDMTTTDIWKYVFHSGYPTFKVYASGSKSFTISAGSNEAHYDIAHNLGYEPFYFAHILKGSYSYQVPADMDSGIDVAAGGGWTSRIRFYTQLTDKNTLRIGAYTSDGLNVDNNESFTAYWIVCLDEF